MRRALWLLAALLPLGAQPKLLVNAQVKQQSAAAGLDGVFRGLLSAQPQPAWIGYSIPAVRNGGLGCEYVRDNPAVAGVVHLEPPDQAVILFRVEAGAVNRIRALSPDCEIDAGGLPVHWLNDVRPEESVALLASFTSDRERAGESLGAIARHSGAAADQALDRVATSGQPGDSRLRAVSLEGSTRGRHGLEVLKQLIASDPDERVRQRAVSSLASSREPEATPLLISIARSDKSPGLRKQAMSALGRSRDPRATAFFEEVLKHD